MATSPRYSPAMTAALLRYLSTRHLLDTTPEVSVPPEVSDRLGTEYCNAEVALLALPALTFDDFRLKMDVALLGAGKCLSDDDKAWLFADLQRLTSTKLSPIFPAEMWVDWFKRQGGGWVVQDGAVVLLTAESGGTADCMEELRNSGAFGRVAELLLERETMVEAAE